MKHFDVHAITFAREKLKSKGLAISDVFTKALNRQAYLNLNQRIFLANKKFAESGNIFGQRDEFGKRAGTIPEDFLKPYFDVMPEFEQQVMYEQERIEQTEAGFDDLISDIASRVEPTLDISNRFASMESQVKEINDRLKTIEALLKTGQKVN